MRLSADRSGPGRTIFWRAPSGLRLALRLKLAEILRAALGRLLPPDRASLPHDERFRELPDNVVVRDAFSAVWAFHTDSILQALLNKEGSWPLRVKSRYCRMDAAQNAAAGLRKIARVSDTGGI